MKVDIEIEIPNNFEPCTYGCEMHCPFGYTVDDCDCAHLYAKDHYEWSCFVKDAMEKGKER